MNFLQARWGDFSAAEQTRMNQRAAAAEAHTTARENRPRGTYRPVDQLARFKIRFAGFSPAMRASIESRLSPEELAAIGQAPAITTTAPVIPAVRAAAPAITVAVTPPRREAMASATAKPGTVPRTIQSNQDYQAYAELTHFTDDNGLTWLDAATLKPMPPGWKPPGA